MRYKLPYGNEIQHLEVPEAMDTELLASSISGVQPIKSGGAIVQDAMAAPIASPRLAQLAKGKKNAVIICSDHTRPVPSRDIIPPMLAELRSANPLIDITLLIATGFHRETTREELVRKFGETIVAQEKIKVHISTDEASLVEIGTMPSGAPLVINRLAAQTDLLLAEGFIEPHFFAGYSGGRKSVLPGVAGRAAVLGNHCSAFIKNPCARTGILKDNPIHQDMVAAMEMANLAYIVNVIINGEGKTVAAFAGHAKLAHEAGVQYLDKLCKAAVRRPADIVVTSNSGAPLDQNLYQAVKGMTAAEAAAAQRGIIIIASQCADGLGGEFFYRALKGCSSAAELLRDIERIPTDQTQPDQWQSQILARILAKHRVIVVCDTAIHPQVREMKMETADTVQQAFEAAVAEKGGNAKVTVIPDGVSVCVVQQ